jgi:uncharacterized protein
LVFYDEQRRTEIEGREHGEVRWRTTGEIGGTIFVVSHTIREEEEKEEIEIIRIFSARKASPRERKRYEEEA